MRVTGQGEEDSVMMEEKGTSTRQVGGTLLALKLEDGAGAKECKQTLEAGRGKETVFLMPWKTHFISGL